MRQDQGPIHTAEGIIGLFFDEDQEGFFGKRDANAERSDVREENEDKSADMLFGGSLSPA